MVITAKHKRNKIMKIKCIIIAFAFFALDLNAQLPDISQTKSFQPTPGMEYVISAWVKENHFEQQMTYTNCRVLLVMNTPDGVIEVRATPGGAIIEGWQLISHAFTIPENALDFKIKLQALDDSIDVYFDDVRVFPFNGNLKSFVYDPINQRLMAELDENNYATFYEYDLEGGLVRIKKETERGVKTIQETRSGTVKSF